MSESEDDPSSLNGYIPFSQQRQQQYRQQELWRDLCFHDVLDRVASDHPNRPAVVSREQELSYSDLAETSRTMASHLIDDLNINSQERILFQLPNGPEFLISLFACSRIGVIPVMILPRHREAEVRHLLELTDARAYIGNAGRYSMGFDYMGMARSIIDDYVHFDHIVGLTAEDDSPNDIIEFDDLLNPPPREKINRVNTIDVDPAKPGLFLLSGGTTGLPKAIPRTHNDYVLQWEHCARVSGVTGDWTVFPSVPIGHNASLCCIVGAGIWAGATTAVEPILKPDALMSLIERFEGNCTLPMPTQIIDILNHPDRDQYDLSSLKVLWSGGQKVPPHVVREAVEQWDIGFCNVFGMAEGPLIETRPDDQLEIQAETVGHPLIPKADECKLVDMKRESEVPVGTTGELAVRGPAFFTGYFRNSEENSENFDSNGWFYTEDILSLRDDGNFEVYGRIKDTIIRGGENIFAPDIEDRLVEHEHIENAAVIGMPDERLGERVCAFVELSNDQNSSLNFQLDDITSYLENQGIAVFKLPERIEIMDELPRTEVGKIDKKQLKDRITQTLKEEGHLSETF